MQDSFNCLFRKPHIGTERLCVRFRKALSALVALEPLELIATLTILHRFDSATVARHCEISC
jgi:hypothetical protein